MEIDVVDFDIKSAKFLVENLQLDIVAWRSR